MVFLWDVVQFILLFFRIHLILQCQRLYDIILHMKIASLIVLLAFFIIPFFFRPLLIVYTYFTKGIESVDSLFGPKGDQKVTRFRSKKLSFLLITFYWILFLGVLLWVAFELASDFGDSSQLFIIGIIISVILAMILFVWGFLRGQKVKEKFQQPLGGSSDKKILDWENQIFDESTRYVPKFFPTFLKVCVIILAIGFLGLIISLVGIIITK
jgi:hypothetical protein